MSFIYEVRNDMEREAMRLLREYRLALFKEAVRLCGDVHTAEDLVMRTIETFFSKREDELPPEDKTYAWLMTTLQNLYRNMVRTKAYACTVYVNTADAAKLDEIAPPDNSTDEAIVAHDEAELVRRAIASLPKDTRDVIMLRYFESLSLGEIAKITCRSVDSVKCNLYYARKVLSKRLGKALGRAALAVGAILFGGTLLYAAAVATGLAPSPFVAAEPAAEDVVVFNTKSTEDTESSLEETNGDSPQGFEAITVNSNTNNEETTMNTQVVKSAAVKMMAAGAMLAATAPALSVRSARADSLNNYQVLQYLESSGTQAIDTGVKFGKSTRMRFRLQTMDSNFVGAIDACNDSQHDRFHFRVQSDQLLHLWCNHGNVYFTGGTQDGNWHTYDIDRVEHRVLRDGAYQAEIETTNDYILDEEDHSTIWIFGRNGNPTSLRSYATARMGTVEIWQEDRQERLLIPCKRLRDNELGMYDLIKKEFLVNVGTGAFIAGPEGLGCVEIPPQIFEGQAEVCPEVVIKNAGQTRSKDTDYTLAWSRNTSTGIGILKITPLGDYVNCGPVEVPFAIVPQEGKLPSGYQRIAYIESTRGGRQCIDTGIHPTGAMRFEVRLQAPRAEAMDHFGMIEDKGGGIYERFHMGKRVKISAGIGNIESDGLDYATYVGYNWVNMILRTRPNGGSPKGWFVLGDNSQELSNIGEFSADNSTIWLFGRNSNNDGLRPYCAYRLMYADIKEGDDDLVTTHHFVPCRRVADGALGLYDTIARRFLANAGSGTFAAGPEVGDGWRCGTVISIH